MTFPKHFSLNFAKSMPFAPLYSISMQYFYSNAISTIGYFTDKA